LERIARLRLRHIAAAAPDKAGRGAGGQQPSGVHQGEGI